MDDQSLSSALKKLGTLSGAIIKIFPRKNVRAWAENDEDLPPRKRMDSTIKKMEGVMAKGFAVAVIMMYACFLSGTAFAGTINVPANYPSIQQAINAANAGDNVVVAPGTYNEAITMKQGVSLIGSGPTATIIQPSSGVIITGASQSTVSNLGLQGSSGGSIGIYCDSISSFQVSNILIDPLTETGSGFSSVTGIYLNNCADIVITDSSIGNFYEMWWGSAMGIGVWASSGITITKNRIYGIHDGAWDSGYGIYAYSSTDVKILNNLIYNITGTDWGGAYGIYSDSSASTILNNVVSNLQADRWWGVTMGIYDNSGTPNKISNNIVAGCTYGIYEEGSTSDISYNNIWQVSNPYYGNVSGPGNLNADPSFAGGDEPSLAKYYALQSGSPCIDAGDPNPAYNDNDGTRNDMGVFGGPSRIYLCKLILWNKLGSSDEVTHSEIGPNGEIIGNINFEQGQFGDGFRSAQRNGDPNFPDNYILFRNLNLGHKGCIELWYHPDWNSPAVGHVIDLFNYGNPAHGPSLHAHYNDWQDRWLGNAYDYSYQQVVSKYLVPAQTPGWSTAEPFHLAYVWDDSLSDPAQRMRIFLNGADVGILNVFSPENPKFDNWGADFIFSLGSRINSGDWYNHPWEPNIDAVIDNVKIWDFAKADFSDRFTEDGGFDIAPVAQDITATLDEDTSVDITLTATNGNNQNFIYEVVNGPGYGNITRPDAQHKVTYTPGADYNGRDSFAFRVFDGNLYSNPATVSIGIGPVNDLPIAQNASAIAYKNTPSSIALSATDADNDILAYSAVSTPAHGSLGTFTGNTVTYTPAKGYIGADSFMFKVNDGTRDSNAATVSINVYKKNGAPLAFDANVNTNENAAVDIQVSASDPDNDPLAYSVTAGPHHGTAVVNGNTVTYAPKKDYNGTDTFKFKAYDGEYYSNAATVSINVVKQ